VFQRRTVVSVEPDARVEPSIDKLRHVTLPLQQHRTSSNDTTVVVHTTDMVGQHNQPKLTGHVLLKDRQFLSANKTRHRASTSMYSLEYKHVLANILRLHYVARTPPVEARSPGRRSNVENAPRRRPVTGQPATPTCHIRRAMLRTPPSPAGHLSATRAHPA